MKMSNIAVIVAAVIAFAVTGIIGKWFIPYLRKIKYGQNIIEEYGPTWHKTKQGTPTMGGFMFIIGTTAAVIVAFVIYALSFDASEYPELKTQMLIRVAITFCMALAFGFLGFVDDYIKVVKKRNMGLTSKQKFVMQLVIGTAYLAGMFITEKLFAEPSTTMLIPFLNIELDLGVFYYPFALFIIVGFVNAVNLTDGIDGLASSVTFVVAAGMMSIAAILSRTDAGILSSALAGGTLGFLIWNFYPAKVFMGDTGSMFLGGMVVGICFIINKPLLLILVGIIYLVETLSVMMQVTSYKLTKKRIFKMTPIHHHFEMSGYSEIKIVILFSAVTVVGVALAIISVLTTM